MQQEQFKQLIEKYLQGKASTEEINLLESFYHSKLIQKEDFHTIDETSAKKVWKKIKNKTKKSQDNIHKMRPYWWAAASLILLGGFLFWMLRQSKHTISSVQELAVTRNYDQQIVKTGSNIAQLILANGDIHNLNTKTSSIKIDENNRIENGVLISNGNNSNQSDRFAEQILLVPKGSQFQIHLADGTKIWLNSSTKIQFPATFSKENRNIKILNGEAYFEVAKQFKNGQRIPFQIDVNGQEIEVLGTSFNVKAYNGNSFQTSLLEGSIKLTHQGSKKNTFLKPGQQVKFEKDNYHLSEQPISEMDAWRKNLFNFTEDMTLAEILNDMGRWYGFKVNLTPGHTYKKPIGKISKDLPLTKIIDLLNYYGVNCTLSESTNEKILTVKP
ncbi:FecR family protein [Sphingobacterium kyonggiense]